MSQSALLKNHWKSRESENDKYKFEYFDHIIVNRNRIAIKFQQSNSGHFLGVKPVVTVTLSDRSFT